jgi:pimeloyl-ACP methyl ester carboxylesterase
MGPGGAVLVHGAWHGRWCWDGVVAELDRRGVPAIAVELPFTGFDDDVSVARRAIEEMGCATVVVGHSYGGAVISQAASFALHHPAEGDRGPRRVGPPPTRRRVLSRPGCAPRA